MRVSLFATAEFHAVLKNKNQSSELIKITTDQGNKKDMS